MIREGTTSARRRALRGRETDAERLLWHFLRGSQFEGLKFRRQHSVGPYILDFYCPDARLGIEVDGGHHGEAAQAVHDWARDEWLAAQGIHLLRFTDYDVLTSALAVLDKIRSALT